MASISKGLSVALTLAFIKLLTTPFDKWKAFELGLIDETGAKIKDAETKEEEKEFNSYNNLVRNLKRLIAKIPGGGTQFGSLIAGIKLIQEEHGIDIDLALDMIYEKFELDDVYETNLTYENYLYETIYNEIYEKSAINVKNNKQEIINIGKHKINKITTESGIYYLP